MLTNLLSGTKHRILSPFQVYPRQLFMRYSMPYAEGACGQLEGWWMLGDYFHSQATDEALFWKLELKKSASA